MTVNQTIYAYITDNGDGSSTTRVYATDKELLAEVSARHQAVTGMDFDEAKEWCSDDPYERGALDVKQVAFTVGHNGEIFFKPIVFSAG